MALKKRIGSENGEPYNTIADFTEDGSISFYKSKNRRVLSAGQIERGKGKNSGRAAGKNPKRGFEIRFNDDGTETRTYFEIDEENADDINYSRTRKFAESVANRG